ncbi:unnamed protein product [Rotaria socialis]|uniref:Uncharacterized protein n=1 Tax=Rotaria socialis TaxID=392032 RepID=A0A821P721_9BILA|nr:unnamed protein product [Rotaria socialis]CAF4799247.1 unnamed protein product [Rotaria socialis]
MFHSLMYNKRGFLIEANEKKIKKIFSPSDPLQAYYYLISHDDPEKYRVIGRSSVQKITNDKAVVTNIAGDVRILKSGTLDYCRKELKLKMQEMEEQNEDKAIDEQDEDDDDDNEMSEDEDNDDDSYIGQSSTSCLKRPSDGFSTTKATFQSNQRFNRDRSLQRNGRCQSKVTASHDLPAKNNSNNNHPDKITGNFSRFTSSSQDDHCHIDTNTDKTHSSFVALQKNDQLSSYRDENDKENFQDEIPWDGKNLLKVTGRDIGDYARKLLDILCTTQELQSSILPSQAAHLYQKEVLGEDRFKILNDAVRVKYRISEDGYRRYYTNTLRVKLSRYLYDQGSRKLKQPGNNQQQLSQQQQQQRTTTTASSIESNHSYTAHMND